MFVPEFPNLPPLTVMWACPHTEGVKNATDNGINFPRGINIFTGIQTFSPGYASEIVLVLAQVEAIYPLQDIYQDLL